MLNTAFAKPPAPASSNCLPVIQGDPQGVTASYFFTSGKGLVDENADELRSVLVCKPWLWGELGTTQYSTPGQGAQTVVNAYGRQLLWSQAYAANENPATALASVGLPELEGAHVGTRGHARCLGVGPASISVRLHGERGAGHARAFDRVQNLSAVP